MFDRRYSYNAIIIILLLLPSTAGSSVIRFVVVQKLSELGTLQATGESCVIFYRTNVQIHRIFYRYNCFPMYHRRVELVAPA